jgi:hypothetical protein
MTIAVAFARELGCQSNFDANREVRPFRLIVLDTTLLPSTVAFGDIP